MSPVSPLQLRATPERPNFTPTPPGKEVKAVFMPKDTWADKWENPWELEHWAAFVD